MVIGFKGENSKLKNLYKELDLKEVKFDSFEELEEFIKKGEEKAVITNYNEIMVHDNATADIVEKKVKVMKAVRNCKKNLYLGLTKKDLSLDKIRLDVAICTKVNTKDMDVIKELYDFLNTDLSFSGKLGDDKYAVKLSADLRATEKTLNEIKKIIK